MDIYQPTNWEVYSTSVCLIESIVYIGHDKEPAVQRVVEIIGTDHSTRKLYNLSTSKLCTPLSKTHFLSTSSPSPIQSTHTPVCDRIELTIIDVR